MKRSIKIPNTFSVPLRIFLLLMERDVGICALTHVLNMPQFRVCYQFRPLMIRGAAAFCNS